MAKQVATKRKYPWTKNIDGTRITLRLMTADDKTAVLEFARLLPENDLLFLSFDITDEAFVESWTKRIEKGNWHTILVEANGKLVGHGSLMQTEQVWSRHLGEIILLLSPEVRGKGLGSILAGELFVKAEELGLQKVVARMAAEQKGAIQVFEKLGFKIEALLADYVIDRHDKTHDLIAMSYDITGFTEQ
ncbi:MAG: GNAT family N-acetyltransferase [Pyrinomonadaceae bacterium]|nr:GNAT family N-acetyltransferase [Pyrinomonadaceae bacterium]